MVINLRQPYTVIRSGVKSLVVETYQAQAQKIAVFTISEPYFVNGN